MPSPLPELNNKLIATLPQKVRNKILGQCEVVDLSFGDVLYEANQPLHFVHFPLSGFISLLSTMEQNQSLEMGLIGDEGMLGATLAIGIDTTTMQAIVQGSGQSLRLTVSQLHRMLREYPALNQHLSRYLYVLMEQLMQSANCRYFHSIQPRLARWLLISHDRAHSDTLKLTHKLLARMLGVRRSGVTVAAGELQDMELISYRRGQIIILNRKGLEAVSCQCYRTMKKIYTQHLGK